MARPADRDQRIDRLLTGAVDARVAGRQWLVAGALPQVEARLAAEGAVVARWRRFAEGAETGEAIPRGSGYGGAIVRLPRGSAATDLALHLVAARLAPDGELWVGGANDEGIRAAEKRLGDVVHEVSAAVPGGHGRRIGGRGPRPGLKGDLDAWAESVVVELDGRPIPLASWPGLFAHGRLDEGTALLLAHLPDVRGTAALDFACGVGVVARALVERGAAVHASDHDALAVLATERNAPGAQVACVDGVPPGSWDLIASNPPIHRGVDTDWSVLRALAESLPTRLRPGGACWLVAQETVPIRSLFGASAQRVVGDRRFAVWRIPKAPG